MLLANNEIINLILSVLLFAVFYYVLKRASIAFPRNILFAFLAYFSGLVFTIVESFYLPLLFDILEHLAYFITAFLFFMTMRGMKM